MSFELALQLSTLVSALAAVAGIIVGFVVYWRQTNAMIFLEYSKRHQEVMASFPEDAKPCLRDQREEVPPPSKELTEAVLRYLNLCFEEFFLDEKGYIAPAVWEVWSREMERGLKSPVVTREWSGLRPGFDSHRVFRTHVDEIVDAARR